MMCKLFRKVLSCVLVLGMLLTAQPTTLTTFAAKDADLPEKTGTRAIKSDVVKFSDISGHWAEEMVNKLLANNVVSGYGDQKFQPENKITREEACVLLCKYMKAAIPGGAGSKFSDMKGRWSAPYVNALVDKKIISGYPDGTFKPANQISREEFALILFRYLSTVKDMKDVPIAKSSDGVSNWAKESVGKLISLNIISGYADGSFKGSNSVSRAEVAKLITTADRVQDKPLLDVEPQKDENFDKKDKDANKKKDDKKTPGNSGSGGSSSGGSSSGTPAKPVTAKPMTVKAYTKLTDAMIRASLNNLLSSATVEVKQAANLTEVGATELVVEVMNGSSKKETVTIPVNVETSHALTVSPRVKMTNQPNEKTIQEVEDGIVLDWNRILAGAVSVNEHFLNKAKGYRGIEVISLPPAEEFARLGTKEIGYRIHFKDGSEREYVLETLTIVASNASEFMPDIEMITIKQGENLSIDLLKGAIKNLPPQIIVDEHSFQFRVLKKPTVQELNTVGNYEAKVRLVFGDATFKDVSIPVSVILKTVEPVMSKYIKKILTFEYEYACDILKRPESDFKTLLEKADYDLYVGLRDKVKNDLADPATEDAAALKYVNDMQVIRAKYMDGLKESEMQLLGACDIEVKKGTEIDLKKGIYVQGQYGGEYDITIVAVPGEVDTNIAGEYEIEYSLSERDNKIPAKEFVRKIKVVDGEPKNLTEFEKALYLAQDAFLDANAVRNEAFAELAEAIKAAKDVDTDASSVAEVEKRIAALLTAISRLEKTSPVDKALLVTAIQEGQTAYDDPKKDSMGKRELLAAVEEGRRINERSSATAAEVQKITQEIQNLAGQLIDDLIPPFLRVSTEIKAGVKEINILTEKGAAVKATVTNASGQKEVKEMIAASADVTIVLDNQLEDGDTLLITSTDKADNTAKSEYKLLMKLQTPTLEEGTILRAGMQEFKVEAEDNVDISVSCDTDSSLNVVSCMPASYGMGGYDITVSRTLKGGETVKIKAVAKAGTSTEGRPDSEVLSVVVEAPLQKLDTPVLVSGEATEGDGTISVSAENDVKIEVSSDTDPSFGAKKTQKFGANYIITFTRKLEANEKIKIKAVAELGSSTDGRPDSDFLVLTVAAKPVKTATPTFKDESAVFAGAPTIVLIAEQGSKISIKDKKYGDNLLNFTPPQANIAGGLAEYTCTIKPGLPLEKDQVIVITATATNKLESDPLEFTIPDVPGEPTPDIEILEPESIKAGTAEFRVKLKDSGYNLSCTATGSDIVFSIFVDNSSENIMLIRGDKALAGGEHLVIEGTGFGLEPVSIEFDVPAGAPQPKTFTAALEKDKIYSDYEKFTVNLTIDEMPAADKITVFEVIEGVERQITASNYTVSDKKIEFKSTTVKDKDGNRTIRIKIEGYGHADVIVKYNLKPTKKPVLLNGEIESSDQGPGSKVIKVRTDKNADITVFFIEDEDEGVEENITDKFNLTKEGEDVYVLTCNKSFRLGDIFVVYAKAGERKKSAPLKIKIDD